MIDPEEWESRIQAVAGQLDGLTVWDAGAVLTAVLMRIINQAPSDMQQKLTMSLAALLIGEKPEAEELH